MVYVILEKILFIVGIVLMNELQDVEMEYVMMVKMNLRALMIAHLEVIMNLLEIRVETGYVIVVRRFLALMTVVYNLQHLIVEMVNVMRVRNQRVLMIAPLNAPKDKFQMGKAVANMIVVDYAGLLGTIINNGVFVRHNTWIMVMVNVFIIMYTMDVASQ
jgi:hypothetical protein